MGLSIGLVNNLMILKGLKVKRSLERIAKVASIVAKAETGLESSVTRHQKQQIHSWLKWYAKPVIHRFWKVLSALDFSNTPLISPLQKLGIKFRPLGDFSNLERFNGFIQITIAPQYAIYHSLST